MKTRHELARDTLGAFESAVMGIAGTLLRNLARPI